MSVELILSGMISRERFGTETIAATSEKFGEGGFSVPVEFGQKQQLSGKPVPAGARKQVL
ncbi:MAG: hypothetical protein H7Z17_19995 [Fuerstia sp.]|nr:hypothetical protein [Fuerstiella sp.]